MAELNEWAILAANNNNAPPDGWPENTMQYSEVNNTAREGMAVMARYYQDINGSVHVAGVVNAYTITLNSNHTAYFDGLYFVAHFTITNTGAVTIDVNGIGPVAIQDRNGNALTAGAIQALGIYELRYDGTQFQLMGTVSGAVNATQGIFTTNTTIDLIDADNALNVGAVDPLLGQHLAFDLRNIQSKFNAGLVSSIFINPLGGTVNIGRTSGVTQESINLNVAGFTAVQVQAAGALNIKSSVTNDITANTARFMWSNNQIRQQIGMNTGGQFELYNLVNGGEIRLDANNAGGTKRVMLVADPDAGVTLYYVNATRLTTETDGEVQVIADGNTSVDQKFISFRQLDGVERGVMGLLSDGNMYAFNKVVSGRVIITGTDSGSGVGTMAAFDPDGEVAFYRANGLIFQSTTAGFDIRHPTSNSPLINFLDNLNVTRMLITADPTNGVVIRGSIAGLPMFLQANDTGGTNRTLLMADPDNKVGLYYAGTETARTITAATGGLEANNTLTGVGFERVLTESDSSVPVGAYQGISSQAVNTTTLTDISTLVFTMPDTASIWDFKLVMPIQVSATIGTVIFRLRQVSGAGFLAATGQIMLLNSLTDIIDDIVWGNFVGTTTLNPSTAGGIHILTVTGTMKLDGGGSPPLTYVPQIARGTSGNVTVGGQSFLKLTRIG